MTDLEKARITELRRLGLDYHAVSKKTGISLASVKSFCRRHHLLNSEIDKSMLPACRQCRKPMFGLAYQEKRIFCSNTCRYRWWNVHRAKLRSGMIEKNCLCCGKVYRTYDTNQKYCSRVCYTKVRFGEQNEKGIVCAREKLLGITCSHKSASLSNNNLSEGI